MRKYTERKREANPTWQYVEETCWAQIGRHNEQGRMEKIIHHLYRQLQMKGQAMDKADKMVEDKRTTPNKKKAEKDKLITRCDKQNTFRL